MDPSSPAFRPTLDLPGGPPTLHTKLRQPDAPRAAPRVHRPMYQSTWPGHPSPVVEAAVNKFLHDHPLINQPHHGNYNISGKGISPSKDQNQREASTQTTTDQKTGPGLAGPAPPGQRFPPMTTRPPAKAKLPTTPQVPESQLHNQATRAFQPEISESSRPMYVIRGPDSYQRQ